MKEHDKYGRGSAAVNGEGFVDLSPGDTFDGLEKKMQNLRGVNFFNRKLNLAALLSSKRKINELVHHRFPGECEEVHKFAAKNVGVLFCKAEFGIRHFDKKAIDDSREKPKILRVFTSFVFGDRPYIATITLKVESGLNNLYAIQALDIMKDGSLDRKPRGETAPYQDIPSFVMRMVSYCVGDVNRTHPEFLSGEDFSLELLVDKLLRLALLQGA